MSRLEHENVLQQLADANKLLEMQQIDIDASRLELAATQERARTAEAEAVDLEANAAEKMANFAELAAQRCSGLATGTEKLEHDLAEAKEQLAEANELVERHKHDASAIRFQLATTQKRAEHGALKLVEAQVHVCARVHMRPIIRADSPYGPPLCALMCLSLPAHI